MKIVRKLIGCLSYLNHRFPVPVSNRKLIGFFEKPISPIPLVISVSSDFLFSFRARLLCFKMREPRSRNRLISNNTSEQVNGLYVHSSPPKVLNINPKNIRQWIRLGDLDQLEHIVLQGQGHKLIGEYSSDPKIRKFLKLVPTYVSKINDVHTAVTKGDIKTMKKLLEFKGQGNGIKNLAMSKNQAGVTLLHKAVYYGYMDIVKFLVSNYPQLVNMKDKDGKTPLHYCGASDLAGKIWSVLTEGGATNLITDSKNKPPIYYMEKYNELQLPDDKFLSKAANNSNSDLVIKPSNIRIWIHDKDLGKLKQVIWEGHGGKLRVETSNNPKVKRFLEGVPYVLNVIKDVHSAVVHDDFDEFVKKTSEPTPIEILGSKDVNELNPLHKAAGLGRKEIAEYILERNKKLVSSVDRMGRTPLHFAAALKDNNAMYNLLIANNADETVFDKNGKIPSYYKTNSKELNIKQLEAVPEAPRTSSAFPQSWDWMLFRAESSVPSTISSLPNDKDQEIQIEKVSQVNEEESKPAAIEEPEEENEQNVLPVEEEQKEEAEQILEEETEEQESEQEPELEPTTQSVENEQPEENRIESNPIEIEPVQSYDIWTNEEAQEEKMTEDEGYSKEDDVIVKDHSVSDFDSKKEDETLMSDSQESLNDSGLHGNWENREKTEREIAEERQRMLDEGLIKINSVEEESEEDKVNETIENEDMEKLAQMVLNGEGNKLLKKTSKNSEIQAFLDNLPSYMGKITAVHNAARTGSLKDLQSALDRRRFAVAKESSDTLGTTPLHVAVLFGNSQIVKYLGGRFPETLKATDKLGRTPLHYAAVIPDNNYFYSTVINLGADPHVTDHSGHTADYYKENPGELTQEKLIEELDAKGVSSPLTDPSVHNIEPEIVFDEGIPLSKAKENEEIEEGNGDDGLQSNFTPTDRDEYGQSILHFAAARAHGRGGLFQLIHESGVNLGYRDELYRTARDVALQANISENINEIDRYIISLAARDETEKLVQLFLEGYDHILDLEDDEDNDITTVATNKDNQRTITFLKAIPLLEDKRERVHKAIRAGEEKMVQEIINESKNGRLIVIGKNSTGRCSLHISVLCQQKEVTEFIAQKFPETLKIGDNLERTALHYAMGVEEVETLSKILIKCGAKRVLKDLKGRQPTYYFMNRTEILKLQEEENILRV